MARPNASDARVPGAGFPVLDACQVTLVTVVIPYLVTPLLPLKPIQRAALRPPRLFIPIFPLPLLLDP